MKNLKTELFSVPIGRLNQNDKASDMDNLGWVVDFSPDNVVNTNLRKEDLLDFSLFNEGNVYSKLFNKVSRVCSGQDFHLESFNI